MRPERSFDDEHLAWPVRTPPAVVLARVQARAAHLRRRRRLAVAGTGVPLAVAAVLMAMLLPGAPGTTSRVKIRPAIEQPGGGGREPGAVDAGVGAEVPSAPSAPSSSVEAWPVLPAEPGAAPMSEWGTLPGPFMPSRATGPLGRLVFERAGAILVMNADGSGARTVVPADRRMTQPDWSPDGRRLVATHVTQRIAVIDMDGAHRFVSPVGQLAEQAKWSPDGSRILYQVTAPQFTGSHTSYGIWSVRPDGSDAREIAADGMRADWSPDGTRLVYNCAAFTLCTINADGTGRREVAANRSNARWSPDGARLAVVHSVKGVTRWTTMRPDGSDERFLTDRADLQAGRLDWTADSQWLVFLRSEPASGCAFSCPRVASTHAVRVDGSDARQLTSVFQDNWLAVGPPGD